MHDVIGFASFLGELELLRELLVGRRAQDVELEGLTVRIAQSLDQPPGDGTEGNIVPRSRPADREQDADLVGDPRRGERGLPALLRTHERLRGQSEIDAGMGIADQLPRNGRGLGDARDDLDSRRRQMRLDERPKPRSVLPILEDRTKQRLPALGHELFDARGDLRRRVLRKLQIVLEIPADLLAILRRQREFDLAAEA